MRPSIRTCVVALAAFLAGAVAGYALRPFIDVGRPPVSGETVVEPGKVLFKTYCAACHGEDGQGTKDGAPPLAGSAWVAGPETRPLRIVLHGLRGPVEVGGRTHNLEMPGFGRLLSDEQIACVLSFVRRTCGGSTTPITPAAVSRVRAATGDRTEYWTAEDLLKAP